MLSIILVTKIMITCMIMKMMIMALIRHVKQSSLFLKSHLYPCQVDNLKRMSVGFPYFSLDLVNSLQHTLVLHVSYV